MKDKVSLLKLIFSADSNWGIGRDGALLFRVKADMAYFKKMTTGKVVVMGRATLDSLPGKKPLPNRVNIVLTRDKDFKAEGVLACHSIGGLLETVKGHNGDDIFVIGGESVYRALLDYCDTAYVTRFYASADADRFMPDFDSLDGWKLAEASEELEENGLKFRFLTYERTTKATNIDTGA